MGLFASKPASGTPKKTTTSSRTSTSTSQQPTNPEVPPECNLNDIANYGEFASVVMSGRDIKAALASPSATTTERFALYDKRFLSSASSLADGSSYIYGTVKPNVDPYVSRGEYTTKQCNAIPKYAFLEIPSTARVSNYNWAGTALDLTHSTKGATTTKTIDLGIAPVGKILAIDLQIIGGDQGSTTDPCAMVNIALNDASGTPIFVNQTTVPRFGEATRPITGYKSAVLLNTTIQIPIYGEYVYAKGSFGQQFLLWNKAVNAPVGSKLTITTQAVPPLCGVQITSLTAKVLYVPQNVLQPLPGVSTPWNSEGGGNSMYLDRHDMNCVSAVNSPQSAISRFHLQRAGNGNYRYDYTCTTGGNFGAGVAKGTPWNDEGGGNTVYFDRHDVDCGANNVISRVHLQRYGNGNFHFDYTCLPSNVGLNCQTLSTPWNDEGGGNAVYLDRHDLVCPPETALSRFKLNRSGGGTYRYDYTCCGYQNPSS